MDHWKANGNKYSVIYPNCTHILVLAVEVSHSPAKPTMSNPVDSWLKNLGWPVGDEEAPVN